MKLVRKSNTTNVIAYHTHQGFGDLITCSPIVNYLCSEIPTHKITLITRSESYAKNLRRFCYPEVEIAVIPGYPSHSDADSQSEVEIVNSWAENHDFFLVRSGFERYWYDERVPWDFAFYENAGVPYSIKSSYFAIQKDEAKEKETREKLQILDGESYAFVHDDPQRGLEFLTETDIKIVKNSKDIEIADMASIMENAKELHLMGSSFLCLADLLELPKSQQKLLYYTFRGDLNVRGKEKWKTISPE